MNRDARAAPAIHSYLIGDELVGSHGPSRFIIDLNRCDDVFAARAFGAAFERFREMVMPAMQAVAEAVRKN